MTVYSHYAEAVNLVTLSIGLARETADCVDLYFTAHLDSSLGLGADPGTNDAYLFGARIEKASPRKCTAKQGLHDQGEAYDFTLFGGVNPANNGFFHATVGFVVDSQSDYVGYPAASSVDPANLPTWAQVSALTVSFQSTADPDFL